MLNELVPTSRPVSLHVSKTALAIATANGRQASENLTGMTSLSFAQ